ncbi:MAG: HEAT repeat domain-containing protein [Nitrospirae bacterium]|nr:HEAT repeat domain-containing protein [Nitrospirota bacterium]MDA1304915.1 HEAT repeat domain-containing protein [Nitrospirota bacterium]
MEQRSGQAIVLTLFAMLLAWGQVYQADVAHAAGSDLQIAVDHDQLTLELHDASLVDVVERVAQTLFLTSHVAPGLEATLVTLTLNDVPFRQGLAQLLANTNYVLTDRDLYVWARGDSSKNGEWRERKQKPQAIPSTPAEQPEISEEELKHQAIYGEDPETRTTALELLSDEGVEKAMPTILEALRDPSPEVRGMALELLGETEGPIPIDQIAKIISDDPNPEQRMEAIVVLASRNEETAQVVLQQALHDSDPEVVELAKSILQDMSSDIESDEPR